MTWEQVREQYPDRWVVIEALDARTEGSERVVVRLVLIADFADDWRPAWNRYESLHIASPEQEFYVLHTDREQLDIGVLNAFRYRL